MCLAGKSKARLEASRFHRYDFFYECFHIVFILFNLNLVTINFQNFLEIIINFLEEIYKKNFEFWQILGQQCEKREYSLNINIFIKITFKSQFEILLMLFLDINIFLVLL